MQMLANLPPVTVQEESERAQGFSLFSSLFFDSVWEKESKPQKEQEVRMEHSRRRKEGRAQGNA